MHSNVKYRLETSPESVSLTITVPNDPAARTWLHDLVAIQIAGPGQFIADVYNIDPSSSARSEGKFEPRFDTFAESPAARW
jgi:hypothetical protein